MNLVDVYKSEVATEVLFELLAEREPDESISHRAMPPWERHRSFVASRPYEAWYIIEDEEVPVGSVYLTREDEIGIFVFKSYRRQGFGKAAIQELLRRHPRERFLANINPANQKSQDLFSGLGFQHIQATYELCSQGDTQ